jgi:exonuclease VII small subunit
MPKFKLSKTERGRITAAAKRLDEPAATLLAMVAAYNEALGELREIVRSIETGWQTVWDKRSERWQDGAAGQSVADTITAWAELADELEDIEVALPEIEIPD